MGIITRQSFKGTVVVYAGVFLAVVTNLYVWPLCFEVAEVGVLRVLVEISTLLSSFVHLAMPATITKFFPYFRNEEKKHHGLLYLVTSVTFISFCIFCVLFLSLRTYFVDFYQKDSPLLAEYSLYLLPFTFLLSFTVLYETYAASNLRIVVPKIMREFVYRLLILGLSFFVFWEVFSFEDYLRSQVVLLLLVLLGIIIYLQRSGFWYFTRKVEYTEPWLKKEITRFNAFIVFGGIGGVLVAKIDILMIGAAPNGDFNNGIYTTALLLASMIELPGRSIGQISVPILAEHMKNDNRKEIKNMYESASIVQLTVATFIFCMIWCNIDNIFGLMPKGDIFINGKHAFLFIAISQVFNMATSLNGAILAITKYYRFATWSIFFLGFFTVAINYYLIPRYQLDGAAFGAALSIFLYQFLVWFFVKIKLKLDPFSLNTFKPLFITGLVLALSYLLPDLQHPILDGAVRSILIVAVFAVLTLKLKVSPYFENMYMKGREALRKRLS